MLLVSQPLQPSVQALVPVSLLETSLKSQLRHSMGPVSSVKYRDLLCDLMGCGGCVFVVFAWICSRLSRKCYVLARFIFILF